MKKIGMGLAKGFVLCMVMIVCMQSYVFEVGAVNINTANAQLLTYDIEMDDYYSKEKVTECMCESCVSARAVRRAKQREKDAELLPYMIGIFVILGIMFYVYCKKEDKKKFG